MLRYGRLRDPELGLNGRADRAGGHLTLGDQLENPAANRIAEYIERVHARKISRVTYISQGLNSVRWLCPLIGGPLIGAQVWLKKSSAPQWIPSLRPRRFSAPSSTSHS